VSTAEDLKQVYQQLVLEHSRDPHHFGRLRAATHEAEGFNPLCGDKVAVYLQIEGDQIAHIAHETSGCAICKASASMMSDTVTGQSTSFATDLIDRVDTMLNSDAADDVAGKPGLPLASLEGVRAYPSRIKCATLPWQSLQAALQGGSHSITTE